MGDKDYTISIDDLKLDDIIDTDDTITISLNDTYGTTTTYWAGDSITDITITDPSDGTFTIDTDSVYTGDWRFSNNSIDPNEVDRMCKEYPALEKVWRNFKSVYDMVKQDYDGKKKAGELDDDIPF